jgi:hypothetical protein
LRPAWTKVSKTPISTNKLGVVVHIPVIPATKKS